MENENRSIDQFLDDQLSKWAERTTLPAEPVITVSMEPGSKGRFIAEEIAKRLNYDLFNRQIIKEIAQSVHMSTRVIESVEKKRLSGINDLISSLVTKHYLHPDLYLEHLMKVINTIADHGHAVIVGRGANFILPPEQRFSVRVVAPLEIRIRNVAEFFGTTQEEAKHRIMHRQSRRTAFIQQAFHQDISDPHNYDLVINTEKMNVAAAVETVIAAFKSLAEQK
jgi:cytidylate kinase